MGVFFSCYAAPDTSKTGSAFFFGVGHFKAIVLSDRLLKIMDNEEILAIVAHDLGHWRNDHVIATFTNEQVGMYFHVGRYGKKPKTIEG